MKGIILASIFVFTYMLVGCTPRSYIKTSEVINLEPARDVLIILTAYNFSVIVLEGSYATEHNPNAKQIIIRFVLRPDHTSNQIIMVLPKQGARIRKSARFLPRHYKISEHLAKIVRQALAPYVIDYPGARVMIHKFKGLLRNDAIWRQDAI